MRRLRAISPGSSVGTAGPAVRSHGGFAIGSHGANVDLPRQARVAQFADAPAHRLRWRGGTGPEPATSRGRDPDSHIWFCSLGLEDKVPDHSTFSKDWHGRFAGTNLFREMFYDVVRQATLTLGALGPLTGVELSLLRKVEAAHVPEP